MGLYITEEGMKMVAEGSVPKELMELLGLKEGIKYQVASIVKTA